MANKAKQGANNSGGNRPKLELYVPEPRFRPGDDVDFNHFEIPPVGATGRPSEDAHPHEMRDQAFGLVRVLGEDNKASGPWDPKLDADMLRSMLRHMALTRAFDDRLYRTQRQGKTSFYMKCTGEEATAVGAAYAMASDDMVFPSYRQQAILISRGYPLTDMVNQIFSNRADPLKGRQLPIMYSAKD